MSLRRKFALKSPQPIALVLINSPDSPSLPTLSWLPSIIFDYPEFYKDTRYLFDMSSDPSSGDPDTGAASMSEKGGSVIEPTSAPYAVDYLIQLDIEANNGLDSLLRNDTLRAEYEYADLHLHRDFGHNMFDQSKEDLWLFHIHLHILPITGLSAILRWKSQLGETQQSSWIQNLPGRQSLPKKVVG